MKIKSLNKYLISIILFLVCLLSKQTIVFAAVQNSQKIIPTINNENVVELFSKTNTNLINSYFTCDCDIPNYNKSNGDELIYLSTGLCSSVAKCDGTYYSVIKLSDEIYNLAQSGVVDIFAESNFYSPKKSKKDVPETITMSLLSATNINENNLNEKNFKYSNLRESVSYCGSTYAKNNFVLKLNGLKDKYIVLKFSSTYSKINGIGKSYNTMIVKSPKVYVSIKKFNVSFNFGYDDQVYKFGDNVSIKIPEKQGYKFNKVLINGNEVSSVNNTINFKVESNMNVEFLYRKVLKCDIKTEYFYNNSNPISIECCNSNYDLKYTYYKENQKIDNIMDLGEYLVKYSYVDDNVFIEGEQKITVLPIVCNITIENQSFEYDGNLKTLNIKVNNNVDYELKITQNEIETKPINAGEYNYFIKVKDYGYIGEKSGKFEIKPKEVNVDFLNYYKFIYNGKTPKINLKTNYDFEIKFYKNEEVIIPIDVGIYDCKIEFKNKNYYSPIDFKLEIIKRDIFININSLESFYGENFKPLTYKIINGIEGIKYNFNLKSNIKSLVGVYDIFVENKLISNKNINYIYNVANYKVLPKKIIIIPNSNQYKYFGDKESEYEYNVSGLINNDKLVGNLSRNQGENVGLYLFTKGSLNNPNYEIEVRNEYFKILPKKLIVKGESYNKIYGEVDPDFTYSILNSFSNITLNGKLKREAGENVGNYKINIGSLNNPNYKIVFIPGVLKIEKRKVEVFAENSTKTYGEKDILKYKVLGLINSDILNGELKREIGENVGTYNINLGTLSNNNYEIIFNSANFEILPKKIKIVAENKSKIYGQKDEVLTFKTFENIDKAQIKGSLVREAGEEVGAYKISIGTLESFNYIIEFIPGIYEVHKRELIVICNNKFEKKYNEIDPRFNYICEGIINNDQVEIDIRRLEGENVGDYNLIVNNISNNNYYAKFKEDYSLRIVKNDPIIKLENLEVFYSGKAFKLNGYNDANYNVYYSINGMNVENPVNAGVYDYYVEFDGNENYNPIVSNSAKLTIKKLVLPITLTFTTFVYDGDIHEPIYILNDESLELNISFNNDLSPEKIGFHEFVITSNNVNYESYKGKLEIIPNISTAKENGVSMQLIGGNIAKSLKDDISISIFNINPKNSEIKLPISNKKIVKAFKTNYNNLVQESKFMLEVEIQQNDTQKFEVYAIDSNNNLISVNYEYINGKMVFETDNANLTYIITSFQEKYLSIYQIIILSIIVMFSIYLYFITRKFNKQVKQKNRKNI